MNRDAHKQMPLGRLKGASLHDLTLTQLDDALRRHPLDSPVDFLMMSLTLCHPTLPGGPISQSPNLPISQSPNA